MKKFSIAFLTGVLIIILSTLTLAGDLYKLETIKIIGNQKVKENTILNLLPFKTGDELTKDEWLKKAKEAKEILREENLFFNANIFPFFDDKGVCKVLVEIEGEWTYQFGFNIFPPYLMVEDRAFLGNRDTMGIELSTLKQKVYYEKRYVSNMPLNLGIALYNQNKITSRIYLFEDKYYARKGFGGMLTASYIIDKFQTVDFNLGFAQDRFGTNLEDPELDKELGFYTQDQINFELGYNFARKMRFVDSEVVISLLGKGTKVLSEDLVYGSGNIEIQYYLNLFKKLDGAVKMEYGYASKNSPYYRLFNLNNQKGVRGKQSIEPGNQKVLLKTEISFPLIYGIEGEVFVDLGNSWGKDKEFNEGIGMGYGLGLRYRAGMPINTTFRFETVFSAEGFTYYFVTGESF